ncbi:MAG: PKD domain-containing protein [Acidobacteriota bacterium]
MTFVPRPVLFLTSLLVLGVSPVQADGELRRFQLRHGAAWELTPDAVSGRPRRLSGGALVLPSDVDAEGQALRQLAGVLELTPDEWQQVPNAATQRSTVESGLRAVHFDRVVGGARVIGSRLTMAIVDDRVLAAHVVGSGPLSAPPVVRFGSEQAETRAAAALPGGHDAVVEWSPAELVLTPEPERSLAWEVELRTTVDDLPRRFVAWIDAVGGGLLTLRDETIESCDPPPAGGLERRVQGGVRGEDPADGERTELLLWSDVGGGVTSGAEGFFAPPPGGGVATLTGPAARVSCVSCTGPTAAAASAGADGEIDFGVGGEDATGNGRSTPAERTTFFLVERLRRQASRHLGSPFLTDPLDIRTNLRGSCNAYFDGRTLNFMRSSSRCANTGELRGVIAHEWGHGLDAADGLPASSVSVDAATGEAVADIVDILRGRDACIGEGFYRNSFDWPSDECTGVRDLDPTSVGHRRGRLTVANAVDACPTSDLYRGVLGFEGHCEGEILGQAFWGLIENLRTGLGRDGTPLPGGALPEEEAWEVAERIFYRSRALLAAYAPSDLQSIGMGAHEAFLLADDEGDGLADGTPHASYIEDALGAHGLLEAGLRPPDAAPCTPPADPTLAVAVGSDPGSGLPRMELTWSDVGADSHVVLRADDADEAYVPVAELGVGVTAWSDRSVLPGRTYLYRVLAADAAGCTSHGTSSVTATAGPVLTIDALRLDDAAGGDGDLLLSYGEEAELAIDLRNVGGADALDLSVTLASTDPLLVVTTAGPLDYGTVGVGAVAASPGSFVIRADPGAPSHQQLLLSGVTSDGACLRLTVPVELGTEELVVVSSTLDDAAGGDGNGAWDPGESVRVNWELREDGLLPVQSIQGVLTLAPGAPAGITIDVGSDTWPDLAPGASAHDLAAFELTADMTVPRGARVPFLLSVTTAGAGPVDLPVDLLVGGLPPGQLEWSDGPRTIIEQQTPLVLQLDDDDGDGRVTGCDIPDVVYRAGVLANSGLVAMSGDGSRELWRSVDPCFDLASGSQAAGADIDGDGASEIVVVGRDGHACAFDEDGTRLWRTDRIMMSGQRGMPTNYAGMPKIRDLDHDGDIEILIGYTLLDAADGSVIWEKFWDNWGPTMIADLDLDGSEELIGGYYEPSMGADRPRTVDTAGILDPRVFDGFSWGGGVTQLDLDPEPELVYMDQFVHLHAENHDGTEVFPPIELAPLTQTGGTATPCAGDFDGDGFSEIAVPSRDFLHVFDQDGTELWTHARDGEYFGSCSVFDFDLDGRPEIVTHDKQFLHVLSGTGSVLWEHEARSPWDHWNTPVIADVDADGSAELVVMRTPSGASTELFVFGNPAWPPARRIWGEHAYAVTEIEDGGAVASELNRSWLSHGMINGQVAACGCADSVLSLAVDSSCDGTTACLTADTTGDVAEVRWDFGDGSPPVSGAVACHDFGGAGTRVVTVELVDSAGCSVTRREVVELPEPLTLTVPDVTICIAERTCLTVVPSGGTGPYEVTWSFGDGTPDEVGEEVCHAWPPGDFTVAARVRDAAGCLVENVRTFPVGRVPASVGPVLRPLGHGDPLAPMISSSWDWSGDQGLPRPTDQSYVFLRGSEPELLLRVVGSEGLAATSFTEETPAGGPRLHFFKVLAEDPCGLESEN